MMLEQGVVCFDNPPPCFTVLLFNPAGRAGEGPARSLDRHGPEPEPFLRPLLVLKDAPHEQLTMEGCKVWTTWPFRIRPSV